MLQLNFWIPPSTSLPVRADEAGGVQIQQDLVLGSVLNMAWDTWSITPVSKSHVRELTRVYLNILKDVLYAYPTMESDLLKDGLRLIHLAEQRGIHLFMVDLPALGKHLDRCLADGQYKLSGLPAAKRISGRVPIPKLFRGLYLLVFHENGSLKEDIDVTALFFLRQLLVCAKRASIQCSDEAIQAEVLEFLRTDDQLPVPSPWWEAPSVTTEETRSHFKGFALEVRYLSKIEMLYSGISTGGANRQTGRNLLMMVDKVANLISTTLGPYRFEEWDFRHGPGSVSDCRCGENRYRFKNWSDRLESEFPLADCGFHDYASWGDRVRTSKGNLSGEEPFSKLIDVPKTLTKPRLIASEPSEHMWCQQNIRHYIYTRVADSWIGEFLKFRDQTQNQELCLRGSVDGSLVTVDLSAASDRVSCLCVGNMFRANLGLLHALRSSRTRFVSISQINGGLLHELRMYSTMGNATTFPVESLIFLSIAITATLWAEGHRSVSLAKVRSLAGKVSVFGDDIIVPKDSWGPLKLLLEVFDFKVNTTKSFGTGLFRESCGVDAYAGQNITPAYWHGLFDGTPESYASVLATSNNFYQRLLVNAAEQIRSTMQVGKIRFPLVPHGSGVSGFTSFVNPGVPPVVKTRWNLDLQRWECWVPCFISRSPRTPITDDTALLQFFTEHPLPTTQWKGGVPERPMLKVKHRWVEIDAVYGGDLPQNKGWDRRTP